MNKHIPTHMITGEGFALILPHDQSLPIDNQPCGAVWKLT
jgi:hypothetical protein